MLDRSVSRRGFVITAGTVLGLVACQGFLPVALADVAGAPQDAVPTDQPEEGACWAPDVRRALDDFIGRYGVGSPHYAPGSSYAVFDFDNTTCIFDIEEHMLHHQCEHLCYVLEPQEFRAALEANLSDFDRERSLDGVTFTYRGLIADVVAAYASLWESCGPFTPEGADAETLAALADDPSWHEFIAKNGFLFDAVCSEESVSTSYIYAMQFFTGMTREQVYELAFRFHAIGDAEETAKVVWTSPETVESNVGVVTCTWTDGVSVTRELRDLYAELADSGIDVWICSGSSVDAVCAAVDYWGLHDFVTGVIGMTMQMENGVHTTRFDQETGYARLAQADGTWVMDDVAVGAATSWEGKVTTINNVLVPRYGAGPLLCACDSSGDFNFCTEFANTKLVLVFNRADRKITDGGCLMALAALRQQDAGLDLDAANAAGDTLYVLQGRDENGLRSLRASNATLRYGESEETLVRDSSVEEVLDAIRSDPYFSLDEFFGEYAIGFLDDYVGYHFYK